MCRQGLAKARLREPKLKAKTANSETQIVVHEEGKDLQKLSVSKKPWAVPGSSPKAHRGPHNLSIFVDVRRFRPPEALSGPQERQKTPRDETPVPEKKARTSEDRAYKKTNEKTNENFKICRDPGASGDPPGTSEDLREPSKAFPPFSSDQNPDLQLHDFLPEAPGGRKLRKTVRAN